MLMLRRISLVFFLSFSLLVITGCDEDDDGNEPVMPEFELIVANGLAGTLSLIDLDTGTVENDAIVVGQSPQSIAVTEDGLTAYVTNSLDNTVQVIDLISREDVALIDMGANANPWDVVLDEARGFGYVSNTIASQIAEIHLETNQVTRTLDVGKSPQDLLIHDGKLYSANSGFDFTTYAYDPATVSVIDLGTFTVTATIPVSLNAGAFALDGENELHVLATGNYGFGDPAVFAQVDIIDLNTNTVSDSIAIGSSPGGILYHQGSMYLAGFGVGILNYDPVSNTILHGLDDPLTTLADSGAMIGRGDFVYFNIFGEDKVGILDVTTGEVSGEFLVGDGPQAIAVR
ncbi:MAG: hypothetical protein D6675_01330 [Gemmatimonadetes bacterium]|nr:MAG: hypothetical protein D6675_01330 [Gemmatimonadota bacterium]